jgi:hypothetical protein
LRTSSSASCRSYSQQNREGRLMPDALLALPLGCRKVAAQAGSPVRPTFAVSNRAQVRNLIRNGV